jgi:hypothetical protein
MRKELIMRKAAALGRTHAQADLIWWAPPTDAVYAQKVLDGMDDKDPLIMDTLPGPDLTGQLEDVYSDVDLMEDVELDGSTPHQEARFRKYYRETCEAYEKGYMSTVILAVWEACRKVIDARK